MVACKSKGDNLISAADRETIDFSYLLQDKAFTFRTPYFIVDRALLKKNISLLSEIKQETGCRILLALKAFAMPAAFPDIRPFLDGVSASSPYEARLGRNNFKGEVHTFAAAYSENDFSVIEDLSDYIVFNSLSLYERFMKNIKFGERNSEENSEGDSVGKKVFYGLRINPEHRETDVMLYDPCAPYSRLGIVRKNFPERLPDYISGLHFHTLCEKNADALERTLKVAEDKFGSLFQQCTWVNFGGGHHITRPDYDVELLCRLITSFQKKYEVRVYIEPGEAVVLNTGFLVSEVLDIVENEIGIAVLDISAAAHTPDVLEMPYRPEVFEAGLPGAKSHTYRLAGISCLAGDIIGDYSFDKPLIVGSRLIFTDMAHYTMVKTNTFNGIGLPDIYYYDSKEGQVLHHKTFGYEDFAGRL